MTERVGDRREVEEVQRFVERFATSLMESGMARMPSRVFAALLATDSGRMTAAEIGDMLEISPAAVSGSVRYLMQVNLISREREPGKRRDVYRVHDDSWYEASVRSEQILTRMEGSLREGIGVLGEKSPAGNRLRETLEFFEFWQRELPGVLEQWRVYRDELRRRDGRS